MEQKDIRLSEAMMQNAEHRRWVWETPGIHVEVKNGRIPSDAKSIKTFVMKSSFGGFRVGVEYTPSNSKTTIAFAVAIVSTSEEIAEKFPNLFELNGTSISS